MSVDVRVCPPERFVELLKTAEVAFSEDLPDDMIGRVERVADKERWFAPFDGDRIVGTGGVFSLNLSVPGGELPTGGVTFVTVLPSHRRRGLMSGMMRLMVDDCHRRGEPLAALWAAEGAIYQRFGFGLATCCMNLEAEPGSVGFAREWPCEGTFRLLPPGEGLEAVAPVYEAARGERAGFLARTPDWWLGILPLVEKDARGGEARRLVLYETDDGPEAYAVYKTKGAWTARGPAATLMVEEAIGSTPRGTRELWRYLLGVDLVRTLKAGRLPYDHPLFALAAEPRRLGTTMGDGLWLRIVDAAAALEGRTYGVGGHGNGRLTLEPGRGRRPGASDADRRRGGPGDGRSRSRVAVPGRSHRDCSRGRRSSSRTAHGRSGPGGWPLPDGSSAVVPAGVLGRRRPGSVERVT
jgi:GNAT superfamily N-acetyltransferase